VDAFSYSLESLTDISFRCFRRCDPRNDLPYLKSVHRRCWSYCLGCSVVGTLPKVFLLVSGRRLGELLALTRKLYRLLLGPVSSLSIIGPRSLCLLTSLLGLNTPEYLLVEYSSRSWKVCLLIANSVLTI
jgi:hypothetical protein